EFTERTDGARDRRPVREVVGVSPSLVEFWSSRRAAIEIRQAQLADEFQTRHGRPPTPAETIRLAQLATLETRQAKHEPRSYEEQRATWRAEAEQAIGARGIADMIRVSVGRATASRSEVIPDLMLDQVAAGVVGRVAQDRATWQVWHLRAEASRRAREFATAETEALTQQLVERAIALSLPLDEPRDDVDEPSALRRRDGTPMYEVAGSRLFTSAAVVEAERRVLAAAGAAGGRRCDEAVVEIALLESVANGVILNDGQAELVRRMITSGKRVELALAAAGTGKTTALRVLARAWEESGGTVLGLAPSAAAAATLGEAVGAATTIAKMLWDIRNGQRSPVGPSTLIVVDEAGMTDTLSLAALVDHAMPTGASVRLVGDDHQLASIGAGGTLRDLQRTHGAIHLDEVLRFSDDGEKLASLALREGDASAIAWYLDHDRIHAGSHETALDDALEAWLEDTRRGDASLMLAGTRETVAELNRRASTALQPITEQEPAVGLADGNLGRVGDVVLSRRNDRRLRLSATDWVKNGDRWIIERIHRDGALTVRDRTRSLRTVLPADYVAVHLELGYATTVHTAQGVTVDSTHTILTGAESRQQLYVALTRGRHANHVYVPVDGSGDEHAAFHPGTLRPPTAVEIVESVITRDGSARSVATELAEAQKPEILLPSAVDRYCDAIAVALQEIRVDEATSLEHEADSIVAGITDSDAWPTLRCRLLFTAHPSDELRRIAAGHHWAEVKDPAGLLASLIPQPTSGPLPWLPRLPEALRSHATWGDYLQARADRITNLAHQIREEARDAAPPAWMPEGEPLPPNLIADVAVWRAAMGVPPADERPTGARVMAGTAGTYQQWLDRQLTPATSTFGMAQLGQLGQGLENDPDTRRLEHYLARLQEQGLPVAEILGTALRERPLPAERPASALAWRVRQLVQAHPAPSITGELSPRVGGHREPKSAPIQSLRPSMPPQEKHQLRPKDQRIAGVDR
ncbi:MAG: AAA family ATPase, partial [Propionibacterium sp.]|nr:AAA family ATPase [Propionibacterium sp.]